MGRGEAGEESGEIRRIPRPRRDFDWIELRRDSRQFRSDRARRQASAAQIGRIFHHRVGDQQIEFRLHRHVRRTHPALDRVGVVVQRVQPFLIGGAEERHQTGGRRYGAGRIGPDRVEAALGIEAPQGIQIAQALAVDRKRTVPAEAPRDGDIGFGFRCGNWCIGRIRLRERRRHVGQAAAERDNDQDVTEKASH
jgi:hypothetical protein